MAIRSTGTLRQVQEEILDAYRAQLSAIPEPPAVEAPVEPPARHLARVSAVVTSDATYGPHLMVVPQSLSGSPPTPSDSAIPAQRAYPTPNHSVSDYSVNDYVAVWAVRGARLAVRLA